MGDKGGSDAGKDAAKIAKKLYKQTNPARQMILNQGTNFLQGGYDPATSPVWDPTKDVMEGQYQNARENLIATMPTGGMLSGELADLERGRAMDLSQLASNIAMDEYNKIYGAAMGAPQTSLGGLSSIAGSQAAAQAQETAGKYGALGDIGGGLGLMFGMKG